ncbi:MAG: SDR family NAD(P)-dependent oxidoreductase [Propionibacteriales bacterium]|nr:SDR family NAD(P)-dependent oxidoreductase [Propionibacteriales bacterium]
MPTALITGATSGIGAEFAAQLAASGHDLVLVARDEARLATTAATLATTYGIKAEILRADLSDPAQVQAVADRLGRDEKPIDILINNAGFGVHARLLDDDMMDSVGPAIDVMVTAVTVLAGAAARGMKRRGSGRILNVSSVAGFVALGAYSAVKAYVTALTESLAVELRGTGVTTTALCPGWVRTEFHTRAEINTSKLPGPVWIDVDRLVSEALRDLNRGLVLSIPTPQWKVAVAAIRHLPRPVVRWVSAQVKSSR